jgi:hypothetical protein
MIYFSLDLDHNIRLKIMYLLFGDHPKFRLKFKMSCCLNFCFLKIDSEL